MGDYEGTTTIDATPQRVFDFLSDVGNLPRYFSRMTSATPAGDNAIHTTAKLPNGREVAGEAWFTVDAAAQHLAWGSQGPSGYQGHLDVRPGEEGGSRVDVHLHTERVGDGDLQVQNGVEETLSALKVAIAESGAAAAG